MNIEHNPEEYHQNVDKNTYAERAFQRAIIALKSAILNDDEITWIDIELPIKEGKTDRFDLIGETSEGSYVLCELKFALGTQNGDSPEKATTQVLQYKDALIDYATRLKAAGQNFNLHLNAAYKQLNIEKLINQPIRLIVAANNKYWENYPHPTKNAIVEYYKVNIESDWFLRQSEALPESCSTYKPSMPMFTRYWSRV